MHVLSAPVGKVYVNVGPNKFKSPCPMSNFVSRRSAVLYKVVCSLNVSTFWFTCRVGLFRFAMNSLVGRRMSVTVHQEKEAMTRDRRTMWNALLSQMWIYTMKTDVYKSCIVTNTGAYDECIEWSIMSIMDTKSFLKTEKHLKLPFS